MYSCIKGLAVLTGKIAVYLYCMWSICENICFGSLEIAIAMAIATSYKASEGFCRIYYTGYTTRRRKINRSDSLGTGCLF